MEPDSAPPLRCGVVLAGVADATGAIAAAASKAYGAAWSWGQYGKYADPDDPDFYERQQKYDDAELRMLVLMRDRLSIPEGDLALPPPGYSWEQAQIPTAEPE